VSTLRDLVEEYSYLEPVDIEHLQRLAGDWHIVADLSFADLLMWVPMRGERGEFVCVAQVRPVTAPTAYQDDQVGMVAGGSEVAHLEIALRQGRIWREGDPVWYGDMPARHEAVPVRRVGSSRVIAVIGRDTNLSTARTPAQLELNYLTTADDLAQMISDGTFPPLLNEGEASAPRIGDGLVRLDASGKVTYASPNAQSAYRRMGLAAHLVGESLAELTGRLINDDLEGPDATERILAALRGQTPGRKELEARGAVVLMRALPLMPSGVPIGALVLVRDMTEVRRRDRQLMTKDATIREIHHRVKNNLQTVAALLRLQARRVRVPAARTALEESVRRVASIALVHETLARSSDEAVEFDGIVDQVAAAAADVGAAESKVTLRRKGTFGVLPAEVATPLVMVLNELLQNAVGHAFAPGTDGEVVVSVHRFRRQLHVTVADNGHGLPEGFNLDASERLGLQIVRTLATGELRGMIELRDRVGGGTEAVLVVPLAKK
jgi:two-component system, sensor histidine kinase PdtaS